MDNHSLWFCPLPFCPFALLPFCPFALLPFALLPFCPFALLFFAPLPFCPFALMSLPLPQPGFSLSFGGYQEKTFFVFVFTLWFMCR